MDQLITALATQVPDLAILLVIVVMFLKHLAAREAEYTIYLAKRDELYTETVQKVSNQLDALSKAFEIHAQQMNDAIEEMHRTVAKRQKAAAK